MANLAETERSLTWYVNEWHKLKDKNKKLINEQNKLKHDIDRHLKICSELATKNSALIAKSTKTVEILQTVRDWCDSENIWSREDLYKLVDEVLEDINKQ